MSNNINLTLFSAAILAATVLLTPSAPSVAQGRSWTTSEFSAQQQQDKDKKATPAARPAQPRVQQAAPQRAAPRMAAPQRSAPRTVTQTKATSRVVSQPRATSRTVTQRKATSRAVTQRKTTSQAVTQRKATPRVVTPKGKRTVTASRLRGVPTQGVSSAVISGHNYSAWRSGHRVRHGRGWRTFVALSALGAIAIGSSEYYPYAYISAPENYCEGLTEDGCELMWQDVETIEGDIIPQCVAYCPWQ